VRRPFPGAFFLSVAHCRRSNYGYSFDAQARGVSLTCCGQFKNAHRDVGFARALCGYGRVSKSVTKWAPKPSVTTVNQVATKVMAAAALQISFHIALG
jgi:hypothetical protein